MTPPPTPELIQYYADRYILYMARGNNRMAVKMGRKLTELIVKNELNLIELELFKTE